MTSPESVAVAAPQFQETERPRLFVDIDDTLIAWDRDAESIIVPLDTTGEDVLEKGIGWTINGAVLEYVINWRIANPTGHVFLWSGGGGQYANMWANRIDPDEEIFHVTLGKFRITPNGCEMFIDDMPDWLWYGRTINPLRL